MTTATLPPNTARVVRLPTQTRRAAFARREMRSQGWTVLGLAEETGHCWNTINRYLQDITRDPRTSTTVNLFRALGWDIAFRQRDAKGTIEI